MRRHVATLFVLMLVGLLIAAVPNDVSSARTTLETLLQIVQEGLPAPIQVSVEASDGLTLRGDYYTYPEPAIAASRAPAVLLMHEFTENRGVWEPLLAPLYQAGYQILNVDLRGHGDTGGEVNWPAAVEDIQAWLTWLRAQTGVRSDAVSIVGASIGADLALIGCGNDPDCVTAVALSPGKVGCHVINCYYDIQAVGQEAVDYLGDAIADALTSGLRSRSALLIAGRADPGIGDSVRQMTLIARGEIGLRIDRSNNHATGFFGSEHSRQVITDLILNWLYEHTPVPPI